MNIRPGIPTGSRLVSEARAEVRQTEHVPGEVILGLRGGPTPADESRLGGAVVERFDFGPGLLSGSEASDIVRLRLDDGADMAEALAELRSLPEVAYAEVNEIIHESTEPTDFITQPGQKKTQPNDLDPGLWGLHNQQNPGADISAPEAWKVTTGSHQGPLIAVIDSGADYHHPDLRANIAINEGEIPGDGIDNDGNGVVDDYFGYSAIDDNGDPLDRRGHGSHVTGTIAAVGNNGEGVVGVNWKARILPIKIFNDQGVTNIAAILRALAYAKSRGAFITSNSWGGANFNQSVHDAFAATPGLHVCAAGNDHQDIAKVGSYPANFDLPNLITVGATNRKDEPAVFSNFGRTSVELFAPGRDILSTLPGGKYGTKSGTSMACPHVTGTAGLIASAFPQLTPLQIKDRLVYSTDPLPSLAQKSISGGRLNAAKALSDDRLSPAAPNDFHIADTHSQGARISWTGTGDDGWKNGPATAFEVRVSPQPITEENWEKAASLPTPRGAEIGQFHHAFFHQAPQKNPTILHAAFKAVDEVGNRSEMVTARAVLPSTPVIHQDDFEAPTSAWKGEGRWQLTDDPERGRVWSCKKKIPASGTYSVLTSPDYDLSKTTQSFLRFESRQDFDWTNLVYVDVSGDGGESWERLDRLEDKGIWNKREYDLSKFDGQKIRLKISSEHLATKDGEGTSIDNFEILGRPTAQV